MATNVGVAAATTAVGAVAVAEAAVPRLGLGLVVEPDAVIAVVLENTTEEAVAAALGAKMVNVGTAREESLTDMARRAPSARLLVRAPTRARSNGWRARGK